jgi:hypothetical protein
MIASCRTRDSFAGGVAMQPTPYPRPAVKFIIPLAGCTGQPIGLIREARRIAQPFALQAPHTRCLTWIGVSALHMPYSNPGVRS